MTLTWSRAVPIFPWVSGNSWHLHEHSWPTVNGLMVSVVVGVLVVAWVAAIFIPYNPDERRPGTRLGGTFIDEPSPDWSFIGADGARKQIHLETSTLYLVPHSITVSCWVM